MRFEIVIPTFNTADYLDRCLAGLLAMQPGDFELYIHVQDGGSSDGTPAIVEHWVQRIQYGEIPNAIRRRLTWTSGSDQGLYDAVARGFEGLQTDDERIMTWIGSDDVLLPGALATVDKIFGQHRHIRWVTGQPQVADQEGAWYSSWNYCGFARRNIRWGLHDGRSLPFITQEGTFWRSTLWQDAGGLRRELRLAGDFDLWQRFAETDDLITCSFPLAIWTQRSGQASTDREGYYHEVDRLFAVEQWPERLASELQSESSNTRFQELGI